MLGVLLIDKPIGITSHDVIARLRRKLSTRRIGHAGTLDPLATGLLVVAVGPATRFLQYLPLEPKEYVATVRFGVETTTQDAEGERVATKPVPSNLRDAVEQALPQFRGLIQQVPPLYSAVKKDGQPLYAYARRGQDVEREPRTVHIGEVEVLDEYPEDIEFRVVCSGGTYMRTWAHDLGQAIGCGAHLSSLRRTRVGRFHLMDAVPLEEAGPGNLMALAEALAPMPLLSLDSAQVARVRHGQAIVGVHLPEGRHCGLVDAEGEIVGIGRLERNEVHPEVVIPVIEVAS